jgi:hypothetical protein
MWTPGTLYSWTFFMYRYGEDLAKVRQVGGEGTSGSTVGGILVHTRHLFLPCAL